MITIDYKKAELRKKTDKNILDSDSGDSRAQWLQASETEPQHSVLDPGPHSKAEPRGDEREDAQGCDLLSTQPLIYVVLI